MLVADRDVGVLVAYEVDYEAQFPGMTERTGVYYLCILISRWGYVQGLNVGFITCYGSIQMMCKNVTGGEIVVV